MNRVLACAAAGWTSSGQSNEQLVRFLVRDGRISSQRVEAAMAATDRQAYVPVSQKSSAYEDRPLPIGHDVTISAPHMHAAALEILEPVLQPGASVLDVGVGSGYLAAALAHMVGESGRVIGIDRLPALVELASLNLRRGAPELAETKRVQVEFGIRNSNSMGYTNAGRHLSPSGTIPALVGVRSLAYRLNLPFQFPFQGTRR